ncbi:MAG: hypothetical protein QXV63_02745, partial [Candidatus Aenigmatarchaeota archaeon]
NEIFYQILPLSKKPKLGRGKEKDVLIGKFLFFDLDFKNEVKEKNAKLEIVEKNDYALEGYYEHGGKIYYVNRPSLSEILELCKEKIGKLPKFIVDSGAGYHLLFELDNYVDAKIIKNLNEKIAKLLGADLQSTDLVRIFRLPGSINKKIKRICKVIFVSEDKLDINELMEKFGFDANILKEIKNKHEFFEKEDDYIFLDNETISKIIDNIKKVYDVGKRHLIVLYLSGALCKLRVHYLSTIILIKKLCELTNDNEVKDRIDAVHYTYGKFGFNVNKYVDKVKKITGVRPSFRDFEKEEIKGISGLIEIYKQKYGENFENYIHELTEVFNQINSKKEILPFGILRYEISATKQINLVLNYYRNITYYSKYPKLNIPDKIVLTAVPIKIVEYVDNTHNIPTYEITFLTEKGKEITIGPGTIPELLEDIKLYNIVINKNSLNDALNTILNLFERLNKIEVRYSAEKPGFYLQDGKIINVNYEIHEIDYEKLKESLLFLNDLVEKYYSHCKEKFATILKWGVLAPFNYILKLQKRPLKWLFLQGESATGKTTLGRIILNIWNLQNDIGGASIDTIAKFGQILSSTTFPYLVNEPRGVFEKEELIEAIKNAVDNTVVRSKFYGNIFRNLPSLSILVFTSNKEIPEDDALLRRFNVIVFDFDEKISEEKQKEFREKIEPQFYKLKEIGNAIAYLVVNEKFELDPIKILKELYKRVGLNQPDWLYLEYKKEYRSYFELSAEQIRQKIVRFIKETYAKFFRDGYSDVDKQAEELIDHGYIPEIIKQKNNEYLLLTAMFFERIGYKKDEINLRKFAHLIGGEYHETSIYRNNKKESLKCIKIGYKNFTEFLKPPEMEV